MLTQHLLRGRSESRLYHKSAYYEGTLDDYYRLDAGATRWLGKGAEYLGLSGDVDSRRFRELLRGEIEPGVRARTHTRKGFQDRYGIDLTFNAPKGFSLETLVGDNPRLIEAHDHAVDRAMEYAEQLIDTRIRVRGKERRLATGNLTAAAFRHETSRAKDPQLHTHVIVINATLRNDGQWRAIKNDRLIQANRTLGAIYQAELAAEVQRLGYEIRINPDGTFDLAHISREQIAAFSRRSQDIETSLSTQGLDRETATTAQKHREWIMSRQPKRPVKRDELHADWKRRARDLGIDFQRHAWAGPGAEHRAAVEPDYSAAIRHDARAAVNYAVAHLTERSSIVRAPELITTAAGHAVGATSPADIEAEIARQVERGQLIREAPRYHLADETGRALGRTRGQWVRYLMSDFALDRPTAVARVRHGIETGGLVAAEARYTTPDAQRREREILRIEREGRAQVWPAFTPEQARARLDPASLNDGQRAAAEMILTTPNRIVGVQGLAGTGKTHMLRAATTALGEQGYDVRAMASYSTQVQALAELGTPAQTLASFLASRDKGLTPHSVVIIDEAGVVPTRLMERTLREIEKAGARAVVVGDTMQNKPIEAGPPFAELQRAGMTTATMSEIQRQREPQLRAAVELAAQGRGAQALARIPAIQEIPDAHARRAQIVADYLALDPAAREATLLVTATNEARREINAGIREGLGLAGTGREYDLLRRRDTTRAQRRYSHHYHVGDVIQPERDYPAHGLARGELYRVLDTGPGNQLTVQAEAGERRAFSPWSVAQLSVYEPTHSELAPGDRVRVTRNDAGRDLATGDRFTVMDVSRETIRLQNNSRTVVLPADKPLHLDYAHASTVHSAQGLTAERVMMDVDTRSTLPRADWFYVGLSRPRQEAQIYTDDARRLPEAVARLGIKHAALDLRREPAGEERERGRDRSRQGRDREGPALGL